MSVQRYAITPLGRFTECTDGSFVLFTDYQQALALLREFIGDYPCRHTHDGYCVEHLKKLPCPHERAKELLG